jgi:aminopeptidase N
MQKFADFWKDEKELLTEKNREGYRAIDVGPLTQGYRAGTTKTGFDVPRRLIYPKGAYVLHMLRMMLWDPKTGDDQFKAMRHDFVSTYSSKTATTEDFKEIVEKHMIQVMDADGNHKMNWFFDDYVYGTALPNYKVESSYDTGANGLVLSLKVTQSNVDENFKMVVPVYLEFTNGKVLRLGQARIVGNSTFETKVPLSALKEKPTRVLINYFHDVLCTEN